MPTNFPGASENLVFATGIAAAAIGRGLAVKKTASERGYEVADAAGERIDGFAYTAALAAGDEFTVVQMTRGAKLGYGVSGEALATLGTELAVDANAKLVAAAAADFIVGRSYTVAGAADEWVGVELEDGDRVVPTP